MPPHPQSNEGIVTVRTPRPSLLYPAEAARPAGQAALNDHDLGITPIVQALDYDRRHSHFISNVLNELTCDEATIRYRQDVLENMLALPALIEQIEALLPALRALTETRPFLTQSAVTPLLLIGGRMAELDNYLQCVEGLAAALSHAGTAIEAAGLQALHGYLTALQADATYQRLAAELPALREQLDHASSVTIGINLSADLQPESATILSINRQRFAGKGTFLDRLFGEREASDAMRGITALYKANEGHAQTPEHEFFRDLSRLLERVAAPVAGALERYKRLNTASLAAFEPEFAFYIGAAKLINRLRAAGLPFCRPAVAPMAERVCTITDAYSLDLALRVEQTDAHEINRLIVANDVTFDRAHALCIITGPNSGGKTTYTRAVGQAHVLFQAGLLIPGTAARISPVDHIYTHFAAPERLDREGGRFDAELEHLSNVFSSATGDSLVLLNEPLTSTDHQAAQQIGRDVITGLRMLGARTIFVTHLYELYDELDTHGDGLTSIVSLVAESAEQRDHTVPTYKIVPGMPRMRQHAHELAARHHLSRAQIARTLRERGLLASDDGEQTQSAPPDDERSAPMAEQDCAALNRTA